MDSLSLKITLDTIDKGCAYDDPMNWLSRSMIYCSIDPKLRDSMVSRVKELKEERLKLVFEQQKAYAEKMRVRYGSTVIVA